MASPRIFDSRHILYYSYAGIMCLWPLYLYVPLTGIRLYEMGVILIYLLGGYWLYRSRAWVEWKRSSFLPYFLFIGLNIGSFLLFSFDHSFAHHPNIVKLLGSFFLFLIMIGLFNDIKLYSQMINLLMILSVGLIGCLLLIHLLIFNSPYLTQFFTFEGFKDGMSYKNTLALFLALIFPLFYAKFSYQKNWKTVLAVIIIAIANIYIFSRMTLLLTFMGVMILCVVAIERKKYIKQFVIGSLLISAICVLMGIGPNSYLQHKLRGGIFSGGSPTSISWFDWESSRAVYAKKALRGFLDKPLLGHGLATFGRNNPDICTEGDQVCESRHGKGGVIRWPLTHNDYVQVLYELGGLGLASLLVLMVHSFSAFLKIRRNISNDYKWLWDGQVVSLIVLALSLLLINAYETAPFWFFIAAGPLLLRMTSIQSARGQTKSPDSL